MIRIFIESGVSAARSKGKKTTNEQDFVEKIIAHYFPEAVVSKDSLGRKGKMYTYETLHKGLQKLGNEIKAGYWQFDNPEYWNLEGEKLKPLVEFLTPYFDSYR